MHAAALLYLLVPLLVLANPHSRTHRRHPQRLDVSRLERRDRATFFDVGLGACGRTNTASDFVIAISVTQFAGGSHCFEMVTISFQGKTTQAQVVDECMGCPYGGIDMSRGLFSFFADQSAGVIDVSWSFGGGGGGSSGGAPAPQSAKPSPSPSPSSSSSSAPASASTGSSSAWKPSKTTGSASAAASSASAPSGTKATSSAPTSTPTSTPVDNLDELNALVVALGRLVLAAGQ